MPNFSLDKNYCSKYKVNEVWYGDCSKIVNDV